MKIHKTASLTLIDQSKNHYKFYNLSLVNSNCVAVRYGRIGTVGQSLRHEFENRADAEAKEGGGGEFVVLQQETKKGRNTG